MFYVSLFCSRYSIRLAASWKRSERIQCPITRRILLGDLSWESVANTARYLLQLPWYFLPTPTGITRNLVGYALKKDSVYWAIDALYQLYDHGSLSPTLTFSGFGCRCTGFVVSLYVQMTLRSGSGGQTLLLFFVNNNFARPLLEWSYLCDVGYRRENK